MADKERDGGLEEVEERCSGDWLGVEAWGSTEGAGSEGGEGVS